MTEAFDRFNSTRKGCCKWCRGRGKVFTEFSTTPSWTECGRCGGTGDEPDLGKTSRPEFFNDPRPMATRK